MTFSMVFPLLVGVMELAAGIVYATKGQWGLAVAWTCYAVACVGLAFAGR